MVLVIGDQVAHYSVLRDGWFLGRRIAPFDPPLFCALQIESQKRYLEHVETGRPRESEFHFDAQLGWAPIPEETSGLANFDWSGSRVGPDALSPEKPADMHRIVMVGCSFTLGDEVEDEETWPHRLDLARRDVETANLAMGAYGLDQALLRLRRDGLRLEPDEVWLGWLPAASLRVVTLYRPAQRHWSGPTLFKPRFNVDPGGNLDQVPNPARSIAHTARLLSRQNEFYDATIRHDMWVQRVERAYRADGSSMLHQSALARLILTVREGGHRDAAEWILDERSEAHQLVRRLIEETSTTAIDADARFRLLILPSRDDLRDRAKRGSAYWSGLATELTAAGIEVIDLSDALVAAGALDSDDYWMPGGHYSPRANQVVADVLEARL